MANSDAGASSSNARGGQYQVFLNFHGGDTRNGFTSFLHRDLVRNSIHAFIDEEGLRVGEEIGEELLQAIDNSQIYIPIFSKNYAKSKWCLRELARMVHNTSNSKEKKILPVFYDVVPDDIDLKTPVYRTAIEEHKEKFPHEVESWEKALKKVDKIKGWVLPKCKDQAELVDLVVKEVLHGLKRKHKFVTEDLVGLDVQVAEVLEWLDVNCDDEVRLIGLHGMGGIGKTTLARVIYNELSSRFGKCCTFLDDVRETSKKEGLVWLQKKLLREIDSSSAAEIISGVDDGRKTIEDTLGSKKVLIVLDDVDTKDHIDNLMGQGWLYPGTRIIVTTRDTSVLKIISQRMARQKKEKNSDHALQFLPREMKEMNFDLALQLFKRRAFLEGSMAEDFDSLSKKIVSTTGGLPLALEVIGSLLCEEPKARWEKTLKQLENRLHKDVQKTLMISYDALTDHEREIFLDVACFFINEDKTNANYMWDACEFHAAIEDLVRMSLIKIKDNNRFWMHDQLRDLGREIVCRESRQNLREQSRLWTSEEVLDVIRTEERKEKVKAIDLQGSNSHISIRNEEIERFESLRFLRLSNGTFLGDSIIRLPELKWMSWSSPLIDYSVASMHSEKLVVLELFDNHFTDDSKVWDLIKMATKLKNLALVECYCITKTPNLSKCLALERLTFDRCRKLKEIDSSIGKLTCLRDLNITHCELVERVPDEIGGLVKLERFSLKFCYRVRGLPTSIGDLASLKKLDLSYTGITSLPGSIEKRYKRIIQQGAPQPETNKSEEEMEDEATQQAAGMETSDRNYAIAAVQKLVGIDDRVKQVTELLEMEVIDEVRIIGIYGTDGIGKTTLAKAVYDRISSCFDSCSFLAEVKETTRKPQGIQFLQNKLICDILGRGREYPSFDETIELFLNIFREMKVLIVVDDVKKQSHLHAILGDQLHWFGLGSRIIVTSQNEEILKEYDPEKARTYMVGKLDDGQAFKLFCEHAFGMQSLVTGYDGHANCVVNATEKLPLAVEVVGLFLRGKSIQEWEKMEESMKARTVTSQKTTVGLEEILDTCYEELDQQQKDIFLDIACFISGVDARIASYMWPNCDLPSSDCILMPLAKIGENNELQMHRLLRCLGKRILNQEGPGDPIGRKFYVLDMVPKAISRGKGMEDVEALCFDPDDHASCIFTPGDFESMPDLRFLKLDSAKLSGDFAGAFPSLRWLCWQRCPLDFDAINLVLREVVILDLSGSKVTEGWEGWKAIKMEKLKVLNLTGCSDLLITPNFSGYKDLEILILERCSRLVELHSSIGHLKRLVSLNLKFCSQLNGLPVELGSTTALKELSIDGTSVREIPISIGNLKQLEILSGFRCFPLTRLPRSISYLIALSEISLDGAKISELPSSLGELRNLRRLSLSNCRYMKKLPDSIGRMGSLKELDISGTSISELPDSIRYLESLRVLRMDSSFIRAFPGEIGNLSQLEEIHASWCWSLKGAIPRNIKRLHHLRSLTLGHSSISSLPSEISTISSLHTLDLIQCNEIEVLPELPPSLICLRVSSRRMKAIPLLKDLKELEELCLSDEGLKERQPASKQLMPESKVKERIEKQSFSVSFPKLRKLELSLSRIIKLQFVYEPTDTPQLKSLTLSGLSLEEVSELPKTLSVLSIQGCSSLKRLPIVQCLTNISAFELYHSAIEEIEGLEGLKALKRLDISNCKIQNLNGIGQLTSLRSFILSDCDDLSLPDLSNLKSLKVLEIRRCKMIHQIEGLEKLASLEKLNISKCPAENSLEVLNVMARLNV